jgi:hypothetical protein
MKPFISKGFYGVINWAVAFLLLASPWCWGSFYTGFYTVGGAALFLPLLIGWLQFIMAVFSNNKHGFIKQFPMQMHFFLDVLTGSFLMCSPFVYAFSDKVFWPQVLLGGTLLIAGIFTKGSPFTDFSYRNLSEPELGSGTDSSEGVFMH